MDYRLLYTQRALSDLAAIIDHIAEDDAIAASRFGTSLLDHVDLLVRFPRLGGTVRKRPRVRKLVHSPILVYYTIHGKACDRGASLSSRIAKATAIGDPAAT